MEIAFNQSLVFDASLLCFQVVNASAFLGPIAQVFFFADCTWQHVLNHHCWLVDRPSRSTLSTKKSAFWVTKKVCSGLCVCQICCLIVVVSHENSLGRGPRQEQVFFGWCMTAKCLIQTGFWKLNQRPCSILTQSGSWKVRLNYTLRGAIFLLEYLTATFSTDAEVTFNRVIEIL